MEESDRPNKIRKTNHIRDDVEQIQDSGNAATTAAAAPSSTNVNSTKLDSSSITTATNGATDSEMTGAVEAAKTEADEASKPLTTIQPQSTHDAPDTTSTTGPASETPATTSEEQAASAIKPSNSTNGTGYSIIEATPGVPLSKNQQKKLRRQLAWDEKKAIRRAGRKEENRRKREKKRLERGPRPDPETFKEQQRSYVPATQLPITLLLDCDFDDKMKDNERVSLAGQITRSYSENKNAKFRSHLCISSFQGKLRERFDGVLNKNYVHWKGAHFLDEDFTVAAEQAKQWMTGEKGGELKGVFAKYAATPEEEQKTKEEGGEVIYLSSDSDYTLTELKPYSTYIIGGLVDKNREKGICHRRAVEKGIKTARLPIGEYLDMTSRKVLATNHVVEIMLRWLELGDWGEAFMKVIPKRKGGSLKNDEKKKRSSEDVGEGDENEEEEYEEGEGYDEDQVEQDEDDGEDDKKKKDVVMADEGDDDDTTAAVVEQVQVKTVAEV